MGASTTPFDDTAGKILVPVTASAGGTAAASATAVGADCCGPSDRENNGISPFSDRRRSSTAPPSPPKKISERGLFLSSPSPPIVGIPRDGCCSGCCCRARWVGGKTWELPRQATTARPVLLLLLLLPRHATVATSVAAAATAAACYRRETSVDVAAAAAAYHHHEISVAAAAAAAACYRRETSVAAAAAAAEACHHRETSVAVAAAAAEACHRREIEHGGSMVPPAHPPPAIVSQFHKPCVESRRNGWCFLVSDGSVGGRPKYLFSRDRNVSGASGR